mmetsp:Transcript_8147/g.20859  ORF Transcript_8147/g.20859 Transcript_8147/m.20859 type:complete len:347 (+) Transcript_8147:152-1192(+)
MSGVRGWRHGVGLSAAAVANLLAALVATTTRGAGATEGVNRFVVLSSPRTGSTLLVTSLSQHPQLLSHHEVLLPTRCNLDPKARAAQLFPPLPDSLPARRALQAGRRALPGPFLWSLWNTTLPATRAAGFKLQSGQLGRPVVERLLLADGGVKKVVLFRSDLLGMLASSDAAKASGNWGGRPYEQRPGARQLRPASALRQARAYLDWYAFLAPRLAGQDFRVVTYEELSSDFAATMASLTAWLGADAEFPYTPGRNKQMVQPVEEMYPSIGDVERSLEEAGIPLRPSFEEAAAGNFRPLGSAGGLLQQSHPPLLRDAQQQLKRAVHRHQWMGAFSRQHRRQRPPDG